MARHMKDESAYGKNTRKAPFTGKQTTPMESKSTAKPKSRGLLRFILGGGKKK